MQYLTEVDAIVEQIDRAAQAKILWLDTEVADYQTRNPHLSLIQLLANPDDFIGEQVYGLDVLDRPKLVARFIQKIVANPDIEKVFHNASYDLRFLGQKNAQTVTCTLKLAKRLPYHCLPLPNLKLKTLAQHLCSFPEIDNTEQGSDWGQRPLTARQLNYARMDPVYLAHVHRQLLQRIQQCYPDPATDDINTLTQRYLELEESWKLLDAEMSHIKDRLKQAMQTRAIAETKHFKLSHQKRDTVKVPFSSLAQFAHIQNIHLDFPIQLTQPIQKQLGDHAEQLPLQKEETTFWKLSIKSVSEKDSGD